MDNQVQDLQLTAMQPSEMVQSQEQLISWCDVKIKSVEAEVGDLKEAFEHAKEQGWKYESLYNLYKQSVKRLQYYVKIKMALLHGYYIVPNFDVQLFAVKTKGVLQMLHNSNYHDDKEQKAQVLPVGEGEYKNPFPVVKRTWNRDAQGDVKTTSYADEWDDMEFPIAMAKPRIMEATTKAMALKIFDEIGIFPHGKQGRRKVSTVVDEDPVIIGRILHKPSRHSSVRVVSFMIAWHFNTNVL